MEQIMTTAQLRNAAWDAEQAGEFAIANDLYCQALEKYPAHSALSALGKHDIAMLIERAKFCATLAKVAA